MVSAHTHDTAAGTLYLAAPLFCDSELRFNEYLRDILEAHFSVYLPQETGLIVEMVAGGMDRKTAAHKVFRDDIAAIRASTVFFIILDGRSIDEGAAFELGVAYAHGIDCFALQTDSRRLLPIGNNPMIECAITRVFTSVDEVKHWISTLSRD